MKYSLWAKTRGGIVQVATTLRLEDAQLLTQNWEKCYITSAGNVIEMKNWE